MIRTKTGVVTSQALFRSAWVEPLHGATQVASQGRSLEKLSQPLGRDAVATGWEGELDQRFPNLVDNQNHLGELRGSQPATQTH